MDLGISYRQFNLNGTKLKYSGQIRVEYSNGQKFTGVVLKVKDLSKLRALDPPSYELAKSPFLPLKAYGYTEYGVEQLRKSGEAPWPVVWSNGRLVQELTRTDIKNAPQQFYQKYDNLTRQGGGYVVLSPWASFLYLMGGLFR